MKVCMKAFLGENIIFANDVSSLLVQWSSEILIYRQCLSEILIFRLWLGVPAIMIEMKQSMKQKYSTFVQGIQKVARSD